MEKLDNLYKDSPSINPKVLLDTSKEEQDEFSENEEEGQGEGADADIDAKSESGNETEPEENEGGTTAKDGDDAAKRKRSKAITGRKTKKTKLEMGLDILCTNFIQASETEMKRYEEIEEKRQERDLQYKMEFQNMEMERRREEREHEVQLLQIMMQVKGPLVAPPPPAQHYQPNSSAYVPFSGDSTQMGYTSMSSSSSYTSLSDDGNTYYKL